MLTKRFRSISVTSNQNFPHRITDYLFHIFFFFHLFSAVEFMVNRRRIYPDEMVFKSKQAPTYEVEVGDNQYNPPKI